MNWKKSEIWKKEGDNFLVETKHWIGSDKTNKWNCYIYLYPRFPKFDDFKEGLGVFLPTDFNWGNTYCKFHRNKKGEIKYKKYGSDYQHIHQERFERFSTKEEAWEVFRDAERHFQDLEDWVKYKKQEGWEMRKYIPKAIRRKVYKKYNGHCAYCGEKIKENEFNVDHIFPIHCMDMYKKDINEFTNLNPSCFKCNNYKHGMNLELFRNELQRQVYRLRKNSQFERALRYKQIEITEKPIVFFFEKKGGLGDDFSL